MLVLVLLDQSNRCNAVIAVQFDEANSLGGPAHNTQALHTNSNGDPAFVDDHQIVLFIHRLKGHQGPCFFGDIQGSYPLATSVGNPVIFNTGTLSVAGL